MDCTEARTHLLDHQRGALAGDLRARLESHLAGCEACRGEDEAERALSRALEDRLPKRRAPAALRRSIEIRLSRESTPRAGSSRRRQVLATVAAAAFAMAGAAAATLVWRPHEVDSMVTEAVNDHLRVLYSEHPVEVESGGIHQVKPWFAGRLDFAPVVAFAGDDDFPLQGGAVGYFLDRKAATLVFKRRLHVITLFEFRAEGLPWPAVATEALGAVRGTSETSRGFHVLLWKRGDLGYALVSDVDPADLHALADKLAGSS
jgi:anti-sigma factor RsiW